MSGTISSTVTAAYTLAAAATTIEPGARVSVAGGVALYGPPAAEWLLLNAAGASVYGAAAGVSIAGAAGVVVNAGSIGAGPGGDAVHLAAGFSNRVVIEPGGVFGGAVDGGNALGGAATSTIELAAGAGTLTGFGARYMNFQGVTIDGGGDWTLAGSTTIGNGVTLTAASSFVDPHTTGTLSVSGTFTNAGFVGAEVQAAAGAVITNAGGGTLAGQSSLPLNDAVSFSGASATFLNAGQVGGTANIGVQFAAAGVLANAAGGTISGVLHAVAFYGASAVDNAGDIDGAFGGILADGALVVSNASGGTVSSTNDAVSIAGGPGVVLNAGSIGSSNPFGGVALYLAGGGTVSNEAGGVISAQVGVSFASAAGTVVNAGTIDGASSPVAFASGFGGRFVAEPGSSVTGTIDGGNTLGGGGASVLELAAGHGTIGGTATGIVNFGSVVFDPGAAWYLAVVPSVLAATPSISGFAAADTIELPGVNETISSADAGTLALGGSTPLLMTFSDASGPIVATPDAGGTELTIACFAAGVRVLTDAGEVAVERLRPGMRVVSVLHRALQPVRWVGASRAGSAPVRIAADAFGPGVPHRAVLLSPDHAVHLDGMLVPVRHLVNGASISLSARRGEGRGEVGEREDLAWFHVELAAHGVLLADGLACESYLDTGNRAALRDAGAGTMCRESNVSDRGARSGTVVLPLA